MAFVRTALLGVALASASGWVAADPAVQLIWRSTTGSGTPGTDTITARAGDELTLDVVVVGDDKGLIGANLSLEWPGTGSGLTGFGAEECPSPPNPAPALCEDSFGDAFQPTDPGVAESAGVASGFDAVGELVFTPGFPPVPDAGYFHEAMFLGRINFIVETQGTHEVLVTYRQDGQLSQSVFDGDFASFEPTAVATVTQPNGCF